MHEVLELCAKHDLVLQTCHLSPPEAIALIKAAKAVKVQKIVCTHADYDPINMSEEDQRTAAKLGAFIEHAYIGVYLGPDSPAERFRPWRGATVEQVLSRIRAVGAASSILASDMGAAPIGIPADGFAAFVGRLRELGMTDAELDQAGRKNPAALLGLA
jgi:predicted metal-dependent phosphotriesterase family hydrolase